MPTLIQVLFVIGSTVIAVLVVGLIVWSAADLWRYRREDDTAGSIR